MFYNVYVEHYLLGGYFSNLSFLSKIIEKCVSIQLTSYLEDNNSMIQEIFFNDTRNLIFSTFYRIKGCKTIYKNIMLILCMTFCP